MKKRHMFTAGLGVLGLAGTLATGAYAAETTTQSKVLKPHHNDATHQAIEAAIAADDYTAFTTAIAGTKKPDGAPEMTQAIFEKMVEAHKLRAAGDTAGAEKIMSSLGLQKPAHGHRGGHAMTAPAHLTDAQKTAWEQAHTLMENGKRDEAKAVLDAAGITPPVRAHDHTSTTTS